ncbi:MAG: hypothetical protein M3299_00600 [Thermoproteota archaeon]|nr:hypothetical protein [Thermoproteota archaeon]
MTLRSGRRGLDNDDMSGPAKSNKKTTITFAIDNRILNIIRDDANSKKISVNAKINEILLRYALCYRYTEAGGGVIFPPPAMELLITLEEDILVRLYSSVVNDLVPSMLLENRLALNLKNWIEYVFKGLLLFGGSYQGFSYFKDEEGHVSFVFRHQYGIKWSRVISTVYVEFLEKALNIHTTSSILPSSVTIKTVERNIV